MLETLTRADRRYRILEHDQDLLAELDDEAAAVAIHESSAPVKTIREGSWTPEFRGDLAGAFGMLVLSGVLARTVTVAGRPTTELLVAGDVIRPWQQDSESELVQCQVSWEVLEPARVGLLDRRFMASAGRWPELTGALGARALRRSRCQALTAAIVRISPVEMRILILFWHLADRIGRVTPEGIVIPVALTHRILSTLVSARRPSVTTALTALRKEGLVLRRPGTRDWLLTEASRQAMDRLCSSHGHGSPAGAASPPVGLDAA